MTTPVNPTQGQPEQQPWPNPAPPAYQAMPAPSAGEAPLVAKPKSVDIAFYVIVASLVVGLIVNVAVSASTMFTGQDAFNYVLRIAVIALAFVMRGGQNWARVTITVLAGIAILFGLIGLSAASLIIGILGGLGTLLVLVAVLQMAALAVGIIFMFRPDSNRYFNSR